MNPHTVIELANRHAALMQCAFFVAVLVIGWLVEWCMHKEPAAKKIAHSSTNAVFLVCALPVQLSTTAMCVAVTHYVMRAHFGMVYLVAGGQPAWTRYLITFLMLDFLDYVYHVLAHNVPFLWGFHLAHHTDREVDVSTTFREHPGETLIRVCFLTLWVVLCGASVGVLVLRQTAETIANISQHMRFQLSPGIQRVLGSIFVTSNLHHAHHHFRMPGTNCNYGDVLSIWDRMFGTLVEIPRSDIVFGLDTHMDARMGWILGEPLRPLASLLQRCRGYASRFWRERPHRV